MTTDLNDSQSTATLPTNTSEQPQIRLMWFVCTNHPIILRFMKTLLSFLAAYVAAGSLAVAFVMTAAESPLQYSGTQRYVRVVR